MKFESRITPDTIVKSIERRAQHFRTEQAKAEQQANYFGADLAGAYARNLERLADDIRSQIAEHNDTLDRMAGAIAGAA